MLFDDGCLTCFSQLESKNVNHEILMKNGHNTSCYFGPAGAPGHHQWLRQPTATSPDIYNKNAQRELLTVATGLFNYNTALSECYWLVTQPIWGNPAMSPNLKNTICL